MSKSKVGCMMKKLINRTVPFFILRTIILILLFLSLQSVTNQLYAAYSFNAIEVSIAEQQEVTAYPLTPKGVIEAFCKADYNGAGLSTKGWPKIKKYTTWVDAPGWDNVVVISSYEVTSAKENLKTADLIVRYEVIGNLESGEKISNLIRNRHTEKINYKLVKLKGQWKIENPQEPPHISINMAIGLMENQIKKETDKRLLKQANDIIKFLKKYSYKK
jgi:hypothetical protein